MPCRQANTPAIWSTVVSALILPGICGLHLEPGTLQNVSKSSRSWQAARVEHVVPAGRLFAAQASRDLADVVELCRAL